MTSKSRQSQPLRRPWLQLLGLPILQAREPASGVVEHCRCSARSKSLWLTMAQAGLLTNSSVLCLGLFALGADPGAAFWCRTGGVGILLTLAGGVLAAQFVRRDRPACRQHPGRRQYWGDRRIAAGDRQARFCHIAGAMTGVHTMALVLGAAMAAGASVPWTEHFRYVVAWGSGWPRRCWRRCSGCRRWGPCQRRLASQVSGARLLRDPLARG